MAPKAAIKADRKAAKAERALKPKPKRAPSPYIIFSTEKRPGIKDSHPNASFGETGKILGAMWSAMDEKAKAVCSYLTFCSHSSIIFWLIAVTFPLVLALCQGSRCTQGCSGEVISPRHCTTTTGLKAGKKGRESVLFAADMRNVFHVVFKSSPV
jgi:hypothetical protein